MGVTLSHSRASIDYPHLSDAQFKSLVLRQTERPGTSLGLLPSKSDETIYRCPNCHTRLFSSRSKFASGSGWPAFYEALNVKERTDYRIFGGGNYLDFRKVIVCGHCRLHLGHVFKHENWDTPTGIRYCINSMSIEPD